MSSWEGLLLDPQEHAQGRYTLSHTCTARAISIATRRMAEEGGDTPVTREELKETLEELLRESPVFSQILAAAEAGVAAAGAPGTASASEGAGEATAGDGANNSKLPRQYSSRTSLEGCACVTVDLGEGDVVEHISCRQSHIWIGAKMLA